MSIFATWSKYHSRNNYYILNSWRGPDGNCNPILILRRKHDCNCNSKLIFQKGPAVTVICFSSSCFSFLPFLATFTCSFTFAQCKWYVQDYPLPLHLSLSLSPFLLFFSSLSSLSLFSLLLCGVFCAMLCSLCVCVCVCCVDVWLSVVRTVMHHDPLDQERAVNQSILLL